MSRLYFGLLAGALLASASGPVLAADWGVGKDPVFKPSYPMEWGQAEDPLGFEVGLRYWYAMGRQNFGIQDSTYSGEDVSHILEAHTRIDDYSTSTYLTLNVGYAAHIENEGEIDGNAFELEGGRVAYVTSDFGYTPLDTGDLRLGGFIGYQYLNDSPNMGRENFFLPDSIGWTQGSPSYTIGGSSEPNSIDVHALRLGVGGRAELGDAIDITGHVAAIPYAWVNGVLGAHGMSATSVAGGTVYPSSSVNLDGYGYGAAGEVMVGFHATENLTLRVGARGYYLTGPVDYRYSTAFVADPYDSDGDGTIDTGPTVAEQDWIGTTDTFEIMRFGPMIELTGRF